MSEFNLRALTATDAAHLRSIQDSIQDNDLVSGIVLGTRTQPLAMWEMAAIQYSDPERYFSTLVTSADDRAVGLSIIELPAFPGDDATLQTLWVDKHHRRNRLSPAIADGLLTSAMTAARTHEARGMRLEIEPDNAPATEFFTRHGFVRDPNDKMLFYRNIPGGQSIR